MFLIGGVQPRSKSSSYYSNIISLYLVMNDKQKKLATVGLPVFLLWLLITDPIGDSIMHLLSFATWLGCLIAFHLYQD